MAIFPPRRHGELNGALIRRANVLFNVMALKLTPDEFIDAYILPEHVGPLQMVREIAGEIGGWYTNTTVHHEGVSMRATVMFQTKPPIIIPQYVASGVRMGASPTVVSKINAWVQERIRIGSLLGHAIDGLEWLNNNASDMRAVRALFPALPILLKDTATDEKSPTAKMALRLDSNKTVTSLPRLPREVTRDLHEASHIITSTTLIESSNAETKPEPVGTATFSRDTGILVKRDNRFTGGSGAFV